MATHDLNSLAKAWNTTLEAADVAGATFLTAMTTGHDGWGTSDYYIVPAREWRGVAAASLADYTTSPQYYCTSVAQADGTAIAGFRMPVRIRIPINKATATADNIIWAIPYIKINRVPLSFRVTDAEGLIQHT